MVEIQSEFTRHVWPALRTWGISAVAGPLLGAFIVQHVGWPAIFWVNVPFGILCIIIIARFFDERIERQAHRIDYAGSVLLAAGIGTLTLSLDRFGATVQATKPPRSTVVDLAAIIPGGEQEALNGGDTDGA